MRTFLILLLAFFLQTNSSLSYSQTVDTPLLHDPVMAKEGNLWHIYATGQGISHFTSTDLHHWVVDTVPVLTSIPQWTHDSVPDFVSHVWAPDILRWHGRWWLTYACSSFGRNTSAIGLATSPTLADPTWSDRGCVVSSKPGRDDWNAIDPNIVIDRHDRPWLVFGSFWDGIQLVRLNDSLHIAAGCHPTTIARRYDVAQRPFHTPQDSLDAGGNAIEAPFIVRHGRYYYLFVSWDYCCKGMKSSYRVAYGRSRNISGPYRDRNGKKMTRGGGTVLLEGDKIQYEALGHCAVYDHPSSPDKLMFICHGYSVPLHGAPVLVQRTLHFTPDGWLEVE